MKNKPSDSELMNTLKNNKRIIITRKKTVKMKKWKRNLKGKTLKTAAIAAFILIAGLSANAQDGNAGIQQANQQVRSYFDSGTSLMYAIGAILGLIGAVKVYSKWNSGDQDTSKVAAAWFGSCIFLVVVATIIKSFFGL
jgi:hypothetical protein